MERVCFKLCTEVFKTAYLQLENYMVEVTNDNIQELDLLARYLSQYQDDILKDWEKCFKGDGQTSKLISLSREKFHDHVPVFLEIMRKRLLSKEESAENVAKEHGAHRWEHGLDLRETTKEWAELHQVLMDYLNAAEDEIPLSKNVLQKAHKIVAQLIHEGIQNSVEEFYNLQNQEAQAQMNDLEKALSEKEFQDENIQQTSHDLKGMLLSLQMGFSFLEQEKYDEKTEEILNEMSLAADSLEQLLNNLLDLFRLEAGQEEVNISSFDTKEVFTDICNSLRPLADSKNLDLQCKGKDTFSVKGDRNKVQRIAENLLVNALEYTEEGHVMLSWELESEEDWMLTISDTGPGLDSKNAASLTTDADSAQNASDSSKGESHGEGIGLLIVRRLCKLLNAVINVETAPDEGTTFQIVFPLEYKEED